MKIIFVYGEEDYDAMLFENNFKADLKTWKQIKENSVVIFFDSKEKEKIIINCKALEFGEVDEKFIDFVQGELIDYDEAKTTNFYIVKE
jgi:hypothetical protein